jgi:hypothetical protein
MPAPEPDVSVVVASFSGEAALSRCLESLEAQAPEVVVAGDLEEDARTRLERRFPAARFVAARAGATVFLKRALGLAEARGRLLALTEDHCTVAPGWVEALRAAHRAGRTVAGGVVENGHAATTAGRALYWCEYAAEMPPLPEGEAAVLSGVNVAYDRGVLLECREVWRDGFYESEVHEALRRAGHGLYRAAGAVVESHLAFGFREAIAHLFQGGLRYGRGRLARSSPAVKALLCLAVPAVPAVLLWRLVRAVLRRRPWEAGHLALALPHAACLLTSWAAGEALGYWGGLVGRQA